MPVVWGEGEAMMALLLALQAFPRIGGPPQIQAHGGMWTLEDRRIGDTVVTRWCCVEVYLSTWVRNPNPLVQRRDTLPKMRRFRTVRDYAYYGYPARYDTGNPLPAPGDTVRVYLTGPRVIKTPATFRLDSARTWLSNGQTGAILSQDLYRPPAGRDTVLVRDTLYVLRPQPGESLAVRGNVRLYAGTRDSLVSTAGFILYSDSLVFPPLADSVIIDTIGMAHAGASALVTGVPFDRRALYGVPSFTWTGSRVVSFYRNLTARSPVRPPCPWVGASPGGFAQGDCDVPESPTGSRVYDAGFDVDMVGAIAGVWHPGHACWQVDSPQPRIRYVMGSQATSGTIACIHWMLPAVHATGWRTPQPALQSAGYHVARAGVSRNSRRVGNRHPPSGGISHGLA